MPDLARKILHVSPLYELATEQFAMEQKQKAKVIDFPKNGFYQELVSSWKLLSELATIRKIGNAERQAERLVYWELHFKKHLDSYGKS